MWGIDDYENGIEWTELDWESGEGIVTTDGDPNVYCKIWINGSCLDFPYYTYIFATSDTAKDSGGNFDRFDVVDYKDRVNPLLIGGGTLRYSSLWPKDYYGRSKADCTIDELYLWDRHMEEGKDNERFPYQHVRYDIVGRGRYYKEGAEFISGKIDLGKLTTPARGSGGAKSIQTILGISWTCYDRLQELRSEALLYLSVDGGASWINDLPMRKFWWSWVWKEVSSEVRYRICFDPLNVSLFESPIFDEISIYFKDRIKFFAWILV
jgi:hypothetical protein